jgi:hypothetical protein
MDVVVTVPKARWEEWIAEGQLPGEPKGCDEFFFWLSAVNLPKIERGERVYIVAHGKLRGYAPLTRLYRDAYGAALCRRGGAVAVTIDEAVRGFRGWRKAWWDRSEEIPFPDWQTP